MIVGRGAIASAVQDRDGWTFFCSGVSNSKEDRESEYQREADLLLEQDRRKHLVYFGSLSIFYSSTRYADHKRYMERVVKANFPLYTIVRIGNITWDNNNPNTLINFLRGQKGRGERLDIQDTQRYVIDRDEFLYWVNMIPSWSCEMNITGKRMTIAEIVREYVDSYATRFGRVNKL